MSKIAEQKALEAYPRKYDDLIDTNVDRRIGYRQGYSQAMRDFSEKACEWWSTMPDDTYGFNPCKIYIEQFKNYMQNESEK